MNLIVAMTSYCVIGHDNQMLWHIPDELKYFRKVTLNKPVIMGYNTFESIGGVLPQRDNYVLTSRLNLGLYDKSATILHSIDDLLKLPLNFDDIFVIGGVSVYEQFLARELIKTAYVTFVYSNINGNKIFPFHYIFDWHREKTGSYAEFDTWIYRK